MRVVPLGSKVERALERYINDKGRPAEDHDALFLTDDGQPMTFVALKLMLRRRGLKVGIHANPHKFRHSAAIAYLRAGPGRKPSNDVRP
jgi:site-specific recombinase XerC